MYSASLIVRSSISSAAMPRGGDAPERVDELGPAGVVEGDVELQAGALGRRGPSASSIDDRVVVGQLLEPAEQPDPDALRAQLGGLVADGGLEQLEQARDLVVGAAPSSRG